MITTFPMTATDNQNPAQPAAAKRAKLNHTLPTDRIQFSKQIDLIRAYAAASEKVGGGVTNAEVASFVGMAEATISMANAFLTEVELLTVDGGKYTPSPALREYFKVHQFSPERAWAKLAPLFERSWFGMEIIPKLKIRPLDETEAINDLAIASNAEKKHLGQLKVGIDWLVQVGLVTRDGTQLRLGVLGQSGEEKGGAPSEIEKPKTPSTPVADTPEEGLNKSVLPLDAAGKRRLVVWAPPTISTKELERIKNWLSVQIIVDDPN